MKHVALLCSLIVLATGSVAPASAQALDLETVLAGVGDYVERYYTRTQRLLVEEKVILQQLSRSWSAEGFARQLEYDLRVEWDPSATEEPAKVVRELVRASGSPLGSRDQPECMDPRATSPDPLAFLLPDRRSAFRFEMAGTARIDGRDAVMLDYRVMTRGEPTAEWTGVCGWVDLSGRTRGRVWADGNTFEVLRFDEQLIGLVDIPGPPNGRARRPRLFTFERADSSIRYARVTFEDPDETLMLPMRIEKTTIVRNSGVPRLRTTQTYENYRRFVTDSRIVP
ncbi:MAG: hypothetical protein O2930_04980 [Acidobacteria bacterium]|nr:hypothetical protein [Acidobacteriota bacterium]